MTRPELMSDEEAERLEKEHGPSYAAFEFFQRWLDQHAKDEPDDDRDVLELIDVFAAEIAAQGREKP
jgi:uncharacterized protein with von Willebrand factor type A (vWA) domain